MSRFVTDKTIKIDLGDDEWIEIKSNLSYLELEPIMKQLNKEGESVNIKMAIPLLEIAIVNWHLIDSGEPVEFNKDKIKQLDSATVLSVIPKLTELYFPEKKSS